jgi:hypothetical protein
MQSADGSYDAFFDAYDNKGMLKIADYSNKFALGTSFFVGGLTFLPMLIEGGVAAAPHIGNGLKLYHNTVGMNGGYANIGLNWINQSYVSGKELFINWILMVDLVL